MSGDTFECEVDFSKLVDYGPLAWMVRPCQWYLQEYMDCKSIRGRIHQYFIFGESLDCDDWKEDYHNCMQFRKHEDTRHLRLVIDSELARKEKRLGASRSNKVWELRTSPPEDWNQIPA